MNVSYNRRFEEEAMLVVLGDHLKMIRVFKGYTIKELAKLADIERNGYAKIERGERKASIGLLCKITIALGISPAELFNDEFYEVYNKYMTEYDSKNINHEIDFSVLNKEKLGSLLKDYRKKNKISQKGLENIMSLKNGVINNLENGRGSLSKELIISSSDVLNMNLNELIEELKV